MATNSAGATPDGGYKIKLVVARTKGINKKQPGMAALKESPGEVTGEVSNEMGWTVWYRPGPIIQCCISLHYPLCTVMSHFVMGWPNMLWDCVGIGVLCCIQDDEDRGVEPTSHEVGIDVGAEDLMSQTSQSGGIIQTDGPGISQTDGPGGPRFSQTDGPSQAGLSQVSQASTIGVSLLSAELEGASQSSVDIEVGRT